MFTGTTAFSVVKVNRAVCTNDVVDPADGKVSRISTNKDYDFRNGKEEFVGYDALHVLDVA